ncbi:amino acid adenylation domain-containing protein [Streptomyces longispororuber]|uniref:amino acid adenylation domain-containing protein n=1 Tax=Streptomyces longispororuber TaxID=68230 RepID=UPI0033DF1AFF
MNPAHVQRTDAAAGTAPLTPELIGRQAARTPDAVAVVAGHAQLTYRDLDRRSARLARHLRDLGAGPDVPVGVLHARSLDQVVGLLAIWRAGAAYLPLDASQPQARLTALVTGSGTGLVLCDGASTAAVTATGARPVVPADYAAGPEPAAELPDPAAVDPDQAAYVLHTSGSTGTPKGVLISHAGIANLIHWMGRHWHLAPGDRVLHRTPLIFDAHVWEVFAPLAHGAAVVLAEPGAERDPAALVRTAGEQGVTVLQVVPSVLRLMVEEDGWERCGALRLVASGGEQLHAELARRLRTLADVEVWNTYGPTECSVNATAHRFDPAQESGPVPIGRPVERLRVLVVDASGTPVGVGVPGELLIGGVGVARGYLGRPGQTADRFVPDPFAKDGSRLYRTGDRVRWRADGVLEYLGRADDQAKVNGVRIEPGEIEAELAAHPGVAAATVLPYTLPEGGQRLAAYVVPRGAEGQDVVAGLRAYLLERLPGTHVPAVFLELERLPLGPTGKVDRRALPDPVSGAAAGADGDAPATDAELLVAEAWRELLGREAVGADDDFFRLGGTSLQLTRLAARLRAQTGRDVTLRALLGAPTLRAQAALLGDVTVARETPPMPRVERQGGVPLSYGQRRLWFMDRLNPASPEWVAGLLLKVPAAATREQAAQALNTLVERHEALRTRFAEVDGEPRQFTDAPVTVAVAAGAPVSREELPDRLAALLGRGFPLDGGGPLLRAELLDVTGGPRILAVAMHHITTDGWSTTVLEREFTQVLDALLRGDTPVLPDLPVQYADYAAWQRAQLADDVVAEEVAHWRRVLDGHEPLSLPTDRPRPAVRDGHGAIVPLTVPAETVRALDAIGADAGATRFATVLTGFAAVLARHAGQWDFPVGAPVTGRGRPELDGVVGFFLNNVVLRCGLEPGLGFADAVARTAAAATDAFAHQDLPFDLLVDELVPDRDLSRTPLYQVAFDLHGEEFNSAVDDDFETVRRLWRVTHTDLTLLLRPEADGSLTGGLEYATSLFDEATAARLAAGLGRLLAAAAADPARPLGELPLLSAEDGDRLARWGTDTTPAPASTVPALVAEQAARTPDAVAVECDTATLTYRELTGRAARIAARLRALGVRRGTPVGVLLDRGPELHAALLGVWHAGGAYVPLDPAFPAERRAGMLADAGARVLLTQEAYADDTATAGDGFTGHVVRLDGVEGPDGATTADGADGAAAGAPHAAEPPVQADPDDLAYVIYTSGSTGRPKGVAVTHRGLANHLVWARDRLAAAGDGGGAVFSSVAFDLVVPNLWGPLTAGQRVVLLPQDLDLSELGERLVKAGPFSFLKLTPGHLDILSGQLTPTEAAELAGVVVVAGEELPGALAAHWTRLLGPGRLINEYGPTEASVGTSIHPVPADPGPGVVPIGAPLPGMTMRVLDERMRPVPVGAVGELYVGGTGVARGYLNRPGLTAERFLPDPDVPGARLYRTGDLARWNAEGAVEFLGRTDHQVKIRGYRVETGEIRAALLGHAGVADAVVVPHGSGAQVRLAAYWTAAPDAGDGTTGAALAEHCARTLPPYMVPGSFTLLDEIPLNRNGKVDRRALPEPVTATAGADETPLSPTAEVVREIWRDTCGIEAGPRDNFFHSGGNSILAIRLIAEIQNEFGVTLPVRAVFEGPTVVDLAETIENRVRAEIEQMSDADLLTDATTDATAVTDATPVTDATGPVAPGTSSTDSPQAWTQTQTRPQAQTQTQPQTQTQTKEQNA